MRAGLDAEHHGSILTASKGFSLILLIAFHFQEVLRMNFLSALTYQVSPVAHTHK
jgi:hypothetical protein